MSQPSVERLIGTITREVSDHVLFWTSRDLERKLSEFTVYYNRHRAHSSLPRDASAELAVEILDPKVPLATTKPGMILSGLRDRRLLG